MAEPLTLALWDFMKTSYDAGLLDESLGLIGNLLDPETDLGDQLGDFEDALSVADFTNFETMAAETLTPTLQALSDKEAIDGLTVLVSTLRPIIEGIIKGADGDINVVIDMIKNISNTVVSLKPLFIAVAPIIIKAASPKLEYTLKENAGQFTGNIIQHLCSTVNQMSEKDPEFGSRFMADVFQVVDANEFKNATDTLVDGFLDQKPRLLGWTAETMVKRAKKRLLR